MKRVVSVSLGSSQRNRSVQLTFAGTPFRVERVGTDGDVGRAEELIAEYDGRVDAIGLGGVDRYLVAGGRRYELRDAARMARRATKTPVVDGGGIKLTLEPLLLRRLVAEGELEVQGKRVLLMSAVDRPGMAETFPALGGDMVYGDLLFGVGVPIPLRTLRQVAVVGAMFLPVLRRLPMSVLYPTGKQQESTKTKHARYFEEADVIAGDFQFIRRYMPDDMEGRGCGGTAEAGGGEADHHDSFDRRGELRSECYGGGAGGAGGQGPGRDDGGGLSAAGGGDEVAAGGDAAPLKLLEEVGGGRER